MATAHDQRPERRAERDQAINEADTGEHEKLQALFSNSVVPGNYDKISLGATGQKAQRTKEEEEVCVHDRFLPYMNEERHCKLQSCKVSKVCLMSPYHSEKEPITIAQFGVLIIGMFGGYLKLRPP